MEADETPETEDSPNLYQLGIDSKYGRVFVEIPPGTLAKMLEEGKIEEAAQRFGNEPLFILRGADVATPYAIGSYGDTAEIEGASEEFHGEVLVRQTEIEAWQRDNPDYVKVPD